jgi:predicted glycogen debranching enzyme
MIRVDESTCRDLDRARKLEWLETNGLGGYASSTIIGLNTRRYHGLLTAATKPPVGRFVLLSKIEETVVAGDRRWDLSVNQYLGAVHPQGHNHLAEVRLDPFPVFVYEIEGMRIEKNVFMAHGENSTVIQYEISGAIPKGDCFLELRPMIAFRDYHSTTRRNDALDPAVRCEAGMATVAPYHGLPDLHFGHDADSVEPSGNWYFNFEYGVERERGLDAREDLFNPFVLRFDLESRATATVIASTERRHAADADALLRAETNRRSRIARNAPSDDPLVQQLAIAADQFIVERGQGNTVIAGYHWFADWGRDTMIALPGLTLAAGRPGIARNILQAFIQSADRGMLPNRFPDAGETPEYNTVDATLWLFEAVRAYLQYTGDHEFVLTGLYPKLREILDWHRRGTRYGIRVDADGLLACGEPGVQLTWMDAKIGDWVVTPRSGKPVEIQALWYNALQILRDLASRAGDSETAGSLRDLAQQAKSSFNAKFWNPAEGCLHDVVDGDTADAAIRPNQIFAVSLRHSMLSLKRQRQIADRVQSELLTPLGLRSLSPRDLNYRPRYEGGVFERDSAYHQGTVWPWLMGPFISAYVKVHKGTETARREAARMLRPFEEHLRSGMLGQVSEIADASSPYEPRGCAAQAWSVAELLRAAVEDVYNLPVNSRLEAAVA